jgi:hypothetical protein
MIVNERFHPLNGLLMFSSRLESTAQQFSQSEYQSIRDKSQGMKLLAEEVRQEVDKRMGTSKNTLMNPNLGSGCHPASGFWHSVAPARLI